MKVLETASVCHAIHCKICIKAVPSSIFDLLFVFGIDKQANHNAVIFSFADRILTLLF